jgi:NPCBM/NEW2 domain-containing protein
MSMWWLILSLLASPGPRFDARTSNGEPVRGVLTELSAERVVVQTPHGAKTVAARQMIELTPSGAPAAVSGKPTARVELVDGSTLAVADYRVTKGQVEIKTASGETLKLPLKSVAHVRFSVAAGALAEQWAEMLKTPHTSDILVVRKQETIDYQAGVLGDVGEDSLQFELDGEWVPVKRRKIEGLVYAPGAERDLPSAFCAITDTAGSQVEVHEARIDGDKIEIRSPAGLELTWPLATVAAIHFKVQYLSDLEPDSIVTRPYIGVLDSQTAAAREFFRPRFNPSDESSPLTVHGRTYVKGLAMQGGTELIFRLPGKFRRLQALAGIDDAVRPEGNVKLQIFGDDRLLYEAVVTGRQAAPVSLNVDVEGVKRLKIVADFNGDEVGDRLDLCEARMLK